SVDAAPPAGSDGASGRAPGSKPPRADAGGRLVDRKRRPSAPSEPTPSLQRGRPTESGRRREASVGAVSELASQLSTRRLSGARLRTRARFRDPLQLVLAAVLVRNLLRASLRDSYGRARKSRFSAPR